MFGVNWNDPQTMWLNYTNLGLGLVTLACVAVAGYAFYAELAARLRARASAGVHEQMLAKLGGSHAFHSPELGLTMADGGEPEGPGKGKNR
jgi:hypothetical protein